MKELFDTMPQVGKVEWIGIRPGKKEQLQEQAQVIVTREHGLEGDHYKGSSKNRQVTLIQAEHLRAVAQILKVDRIDPNLTRRNIVVSGINLQALKDQRFQIGEAILETTGLCHPCSRMEENLGAGGYNAMRGHGGITATVMQDGSIRLGDQVRLLKRKEPTD